MDFDRVCREQRFRRYGVSGEMLKHLLATGNLIGQCEVIEGLPDDALILSAAYDPWSDHLFVTVASTSFAPVVQGTAWEPANITFNDSIAVAVHKSEQ